MVMSEESRKSPHEASTHSQDQNQGQPAFEVLSILPPNPLQSYNPMEQHFTLLKLPINEVFHTFKDQPWVRPKTNRYNPHFIE